ncbi:MAG: tRNA uridine-5-carboxymethylaminomethyl(34) synthesis GTPase MnmE [Deltaproteobacteria bacterium]|nr:tRNA uridine-5-carboxymethylaminomethyl(34) synthesis GTPase MnmE [Deltaproteobacteria bacterium]
MDYKHDTIAAIATPVGMGGIGIIKISGNLSVGIAQKVFRPKHPVRSFENFRLYLGHIIDPGSGLPVDEVLISIMRGPLSYTREDVLEVNSHSGHAILSKVLHIILQSGARLAQPGEFTLRAFLNGRIDLTQAEAIIDLINARSETSLHAAANQLAGGFLRRLEEIRGQLIEIMVEIEASMDFPDEQHTRIDRQRIADRIRTTILRPTRELISAYSQRKVWHEGIAVVIAGRVNVGKSSILNRLLQKERALVTPIPGTTRDLLECGITIKGIPIRIVDTAGMRKVRGTVEKKGLALTMDRVRSAGIILVVVDRSRPLNQHDLNALGKADKKDVIVVVNKIDLPRKASEKKIEDAFGGLPRVYVSALTGEGFNELTNAIHRLILSRATITPAPSIIPNLRHTVALQQAVDCLEKVLRNIMENLPLEIVAADLVWARNAIDEITGHTTNEEVIDGIFNRFCLGK